MHTISSEHYQSQFDEKVSAFSDRIKKYSASIEVETFTSPDKHYRMRAEFKVWHDGDTTHYAMFNKGEPKKPIFIDTFPVASERINQLMPVIMEAVNKDAVLKHKLFQIDFLDSTAGDTVVTFIYHKKLDEGWTEKITVLKAELGVHIIGRSRKQKIILDQDFVIEQLQVGQRRYHYQQIENSFTQPNARVCEKMLSWAVTNSTGFDGDLLELYCGNGNFTLPLAQNFDRVLATEISKSSVNSARYNLTANQISNVNIVRMSSEEFYEALHKKRSFTRLRDIDLDEYDFTTIFVDPPRAGLDENTLSMLQHFRHIIYISCNPDTLLSNLDVLCKTHDIVRLAAFDQFPYTNHLEAGVILQLKT